MMFSCRPILYASDVGESVRYYRDALGFNVGWRWSDEPARFLDQDDQSSEVGTALVGFDKVQLILVRQAQGKPGMWLHLDVEAASEVDALHDSWRERGADIVEPPSLRPWGMYEMRVRDPDGHVLRVSSPRPFDHTGVN
jgi:uncharacterized glyoxalase superfamily protein PhnB